MSTSVSASGSRASFDGNCCGRPSAAICDFEARQMFDEQLDDVWIEMSSGAAQQKCDRFVARHAATERTIFPN